MLSGDNGILTRAVDSKEETRGATVKEYVDLWKIANEAGKYTNNTNSQSKNDLLNDLESQKLLINDERTKLEADETITIGTKQISLKTNSLSDLDKLKDFYEGNNPEGLALTLDGFPIIILGPFGDDAVVFEYNDKYYKLILDFDVMIVENVENAMQEEIDGAMQFYMSEVINNGEKIGYAKKYDNQIQDLDYYSYNNKYYKVIHYFNNEGRYSDSKMEKTSINDFELLEMYFTHNIYINGWPSNFTDDDFIPDASTSLTHENDIIKYKDKSYIILFHNVFSNQTPFVQIQEKSYSDSEADSSSGK